MIELGWSEEITAHWEKGPRAKYTKILDRAVKLVNSVEYSVTLRWLFYGLWQEGWFKDVKPTARASEKRRAYEDFSSMMSRLRHSGGEFAERWPIELADDRRDPIHRTNGFGDASEWLDYQKNRLACNIDKMSGQKNYVMVAFEAEAMQSQFVFFTEPYGVSLWPFSGATSIPYKKRLAEHIEWASKKFNIPVVILYFGDFDKAGLAIPESAFRHIRKWCNVEFKAFRAGLNQDQVKKYNIPDDPEKPDKYQWEAVRNDPAREMITGSLDALLSHDTIREVERTEQELTTRARQALSEIGSDE